MTSDLTPLAWPAARLGEALAALARRADLSPNAVEILSPPAELFQQGDEVLGRWLRSAAGHLGLEAEPMEIPYGEVERVLPRAGPALLRLPGDGEPGVLALLGGGRGRVFLLGPDLIVHRLRRSVVRAALCRDLEAPLAAQVDRLLVEAGVPARRHARARAAILREWLGSTPIGGGWLLEAGAGGGSHALLLLAWVTVALLLGWRYWRQRRHWTGERLTLTDDLVEGLVGHRTRLAQEGRERWHDGEDQTLSGYLERSAAMDRTAAWLIAVVPRGWLVLGLLVLAPAFVSGHGSPTALAISLGGMFLAYRAFHKLASGVWHLAGAAIAWQQVAPLFQAAARPEVGGSPAFALTPASGAKNSDGAPTVLEAHEIVFRYRDRGAPVLQGCNLRICAGDRLLLEGPSGGGKSTLASLLSGLRVPESGLLLLRGLDRHTLGAEGWRRRVVAAPQFHENHVLTETFAFNLLMGRRWPPQPADVEAAEHVCRELGLDDLLSRMPAGLWQLVGETGWQLSHGERSRLYMARALLQEADLVILDESFAALDPETLQRCLRCVLKRAATVLVIAHP